MAVFGLVWGATSASSLSPNDVRFGVDMGGGLTGNLVLPVVGDVRSGVTYGAHGTQYTGTLVPMRIPTGRSWRDDREGDMYAYETEFGSLANNSAAVNIKISRGNLTCDAIKTPDVVDKMMMQTAYLTDIRSTADVLIADFTRLSLGSRVQLTCGGNGYEIVKYRLDQADASAQLDLVKLK